MKYIIFVILSSFLFANEEPTYNLKFGFLYKGTILSNFKDARTYLAKWLNDTASIDNGIATVKYFPDSESLYKDFKENDLDIIVLNLDFFFKNKKEIDLISTNYWTLLNKEVRELQLYLIAHKSLNINSFNDLNRKTLSLKKESITALNWLDKNSLYSNKKSYDKLLKTVKFTEKESTGILNVFFKKTDVAVVSRSAWETVVELNPSIKNKVKIVQKSKKIHYPFIGMISKNANKIGKNSFIDLSEDIFSLNEGEHISRLLKFDKLLWLKNENLNELEKYYKEYFYLKNKYK